MTPDELKRLEDRRDGLETSVTSLGNWLIAFIVAVVVGLGIELYTPIASLLKTFDIGVLVELIGTALVTLGVAGELAVEWNTHRKERELLGIDAVIENDNKERIAALNLKAEQELTARAQLIGILKDADEQIAELKERVAWREITSNHVELFRNKLLAFAGQHVYIVVDANAPGREPKDFGSHIEFALGAANWDAVSKNCKPEVTISMVDGVYALASQDGHCAGAAKALNELLHSMGFCDGMDEMSKLSKFLGPPYWPEEIWNSGSAPKILVVVKEKPRPPEL